MDERKIEFEYISYQDSNGNNKKNPKYPDFISFRGTVAWHVGKEFHRPNGRPCSFVPSPREHIEFRETKINKRNK